MTNLPQIREYSNQRILTSAQLAELYETDVLHIQQNYKNNKDRYVPGKHYFYLEGEELKRFKDSLENFDLVGKRAPSLYLWTEKGALMHAKSLGTDAAWDMYERLVDDYYRLKTKEQESQSNQKGLLNSLWVERAQLFNKHTKLDADKFCVFRSTTLDFLELDIKGCGLPEKVLPDGSIGKRWCAYAREVLHLDMSLVTTYEHHYPDRRGVQPAYLYPIEWEPLFRVWFKTVYIPNHLPDYLKYLKVSEQDIQKIMLGFGVSYQIKTKKSK